MQTTSSQTADSKIIASDLSKYWVHRKKCEKSLQAACSAPEAIYRRIYKEDKWKCSRIFFSPKHSFQRKCKMKKRSRSWLREKQGEMSGHQALLSGPDPLHL